MNHGVAQPSYRQRLGYHAGLLGGICCFVSIMLISGNLSTATLINAHLTNDRLAMLNQVMPAVSYDNNPIGASQTLNAAGLFQQPLIMMPATRNGQPAGAALQIIVPGWGGDIEFVMAVDAAGAITGVRVTSHKETPGLADKIELSKSPWITGFEGKSLANTPASAWAVHKDGGEFDQFTGATITPRAMVKGVHNGLVFYQQWQQQDQNRQPAAAPSPEQSPAQPATRAATE
jgi:electron transport complex protein RnfG